MTIAGTGYIGIAKEATFGTPVAPSEFIPATSSEFNTDPQNYYPSQIKGNRSTSQGVGMGRKHEGTLSVDGEPTTMGLFLLGALGDITSSQPDATNAPTAWEHIFTPSNVLPSFTVEEYDNIITRQIAGSKFDSLTISVESGGDGVVKLEGGMRSKEITEQTSQSTPNYSDKPAFTFHSATVTKGGAQNDNLKTMSIEISNNLKDDHFTLTKSRDVSALPEGMREVTFSCEMYFKNKQDYMDFLSGEKDSLSFTFEGGNIEGSQNEKLVIDLPSILYDGFEIPMGGADDEILASLEGRALYDATTGGEIKATLTNSVDNY